MSTDHRAASRRTLLTAALAGSVAGGGTFAARAVLAAPGQPDPVFALIEAARAMEASFASICRATDEADIHQGTDPDWLAAEDASERAFSDVLAAHPTTPAGLAAMIDLFIERAIHEAGAICDPYEAHLIALFGSVRAYVCETNGGRAS